MERFISHHTIATDGNSGQLVAYHSVLMASYSFCRPFLCLWFYHGYTGLFDKGLPPGLKIRKGLNGVRMSWSQTLLQ